MRHWSWSRYRSRPHADLMAVGRLKSALGTMRSWFGDSSSIRSRHHKWRCLTHKIHSSCIISDVTDGRTHSISKLCTAFSSTEAEVALVNVRRRRLSTCTRCVDHNLKRDDFSECCDEKQLKLSKTTTLRETVPLYVVKSFLTISN